MAAQQMLTERSIQAQAMSAELGMLHQQTAALADAGVQRATELAQAAKEGIKAVGESFARAG